jgi:hypothetical protein
VIDLFVYFFILFARENQVLDRPPQTPFLQHTQPVRSLSGLDNEGGDGDSKGGGGGGGGGGERGWEERSSPTFRVWDYLVDIDHMSFYRYW